MVTIIEKDEASRKVQALARLVNQDGKEVLEAQFTGFPSDIRLVK